MDKVRSKFQDYWTYVTTNKEEVLILLLLVIGIFSLWFNHYVGEIILGVLTGSYFHQEIVRFIQNVRTHYRTEGRVHTLVLFGLVISLLIFAPWYVVTTVIIAAVRKLFLMNN